MRFFQPRPECVPADLTAVPQWVAYKAPLVTKPDGSQKFNKVPVNPRTGGNASSAHPDTWGTFAQACDRFRKLNGEGGIGYQFTPAAGISAIDLDHCVDDDGNLHPQAAELVAAFGSWTELSPSGAGLHIWVKGTIAGVTSAKYAPGTAGYPFGVEIFCSRFFMTVTGITPGDEPSPIRQADKELRDLYRTLEAAKLADAKQSTTSGALTDIDRFEAEILPKLAALNPARRESATGSKGDAGHKWLLDCPWSERHTGGDGRAALFNFGGMPSFKCLHAHCADKTYADLADKYDLPLPSYIDEYNRDHALVLIEGKCRIIREGADADGVPFYDFLRKEDFILYNANRTITAKLGNGKTATVSTAPEWLRHPKRRTYSKVTFDPGRKQELPGVYNMFRGFGVQPAPGDWSLMAAHILDNLCRGDRSHYEWVLSWCARIVQDPGGARPGSAIVLRGGQGTGKGVFATAFGRIIGPHFKHLTHQEQLTRSFNAHLKDALVVFADEACYPGDKAAVGRLKGMITEPTLTIEPKGVDAFQLANHINLIMASNEGWMIPAELDSRRFMCLEVSNAHKQDRAYFAALAAQMEAGGLAGWMHDLLAYDWHQVDLRNPPQTEGLRLQKVQSMTPVESYWHECLEAGELRIADAKGEVIGGTEWPDRVAKEELYAGFLWYCRSRHLRYPAPPSVFFRQLHDWGVSDGGRVKGTRQVAIPELADAAAVWAKVLGAKGKEEPF